MTKRAKHILLFIVAQSLCLGVGLWTHMRYVRTASVNSAKQQAWNEMEAASQELLAGVPALDSSVMDASFADSSAAIALRTSHRATGCELLLVDANWRTVLRTGSTLGTGSTHDTDQLQPPESAHPAWTPVGDHSKAPLQIQKGLLTLADQQHLGVAYSVPENRGTLLMHRPLDAIVVASTEYVASVPLITAMTFAWISAFLGLVAYIILSNLHDSVDRERSEAAIGALRQSQSLVRTRDAVIFGLAKLAESRDPETGGHLERISVYATLLANALRRRPKLRSEITPAFVRLIGISSALHDIGKVGVRDNILQKPGALTTSERVLMQKHTTVGGECLMGIERRLGGSNFLEMAREIALCHHEAWDGSGYPAGILGDDIPLAARIVAVADMYDALSVRRVYKDAIPHDECVRMIRAESGTKFDPYIIEVWLTIESKFCSIASQFAARDDADRATTPVKLDITDCTEAEAEDLCMSSAAMAR